jgi:hypothetical protein
MQNKLTKLQKLLLDILFCLFNWFVQHNVSVSYGIIIIITIYIALIPYMTWSKAHHNNSQFTNMIFTIKNVSIYRVAQKKVHAFDLV